MKKLTIFNLMSVALSVFSTSVFASDFPILHLERNNKTVFLIGSYHTGVKKIENDVVLDSLLSNSKSICLEADPKALEEIQTAKQKILLNPWGTQLTNRIGADLFEKIKARLNVDAETLKYLDMYSPFLIGIYLLNTNLNVQKNSLEFNPSFSLETYIRLKAEKDQIPIHGIEENNAVAQSLTSLSDEEWRQYLLEVLKMLDCDECINTYAKFQHQANTPSSDPENAYIKQMLAFGNSSKLVDFFNRLNFEKRNLGIARNIEDDAFNRNKCDVIAIGASHLAGENGVVSLLKQRGFSVHPVDSTQ